MHNDVKINFELGNECSLYFCSFSENKLTTFGIPLINCFVALQDSGENEEVAATRVDT